MDRNKDVGKTGIIISLIMCSLTVCLTARAQYRTEVTVTDANNPVLAEAMQRNATRLLTEFNYAQAEKRPLSLRNIGIEPDARLTIELLWELCPFRLDELEIIERCLFTATGSQIRNIPVIMEPRDGELFDGGRYQEIVLNFDRQGNILDMCFALSNSQYKSIMRDGLPVEDLRKRSMVVDFVERFRTAYNRKDMAFLRQIFSNEALIITGKVIRPETRRDSHQIQQPAKIEYNAQTKAEYLKRLENVFRNNAYLNIIFDNVQVRSHGEKDYLFGVKLVQYWNSGSYSDVGYLFLLWDFGSEEALRANPNDFPKIHVRTWQPYDETPKEELFDMTDFNTSRW